MKTFSRLLVVPAAAALLVAGCGDDDSAGSPPATTAAVTTTAPPSSAPAAPSTSAAPPAATTAPASTAAERPVSGDVVEIIVNVGVDSGPNRVEEIRRGQEVELRLVADSDERYHVHGYDLEQRAAAGVEVTFNFTADRAGTFEVESHVTHSVLVVLKVT